MAIVPFIAPPEFARDIIDRHDQYGAVIRINEPPIGAEKCLIHPTGSHNFSGKTRAGPEHRPQILCDACGVKMSDRISSAVDDGASESFEAKAT